MTQNESLVREFLGFARARKKFIFLPLLLVFALMALLAALTEGTSLAPFVYSLF